MKREEYNRIMENIQRLKDILSSDEISMHICDISLDDHKLLSLFNGNLFNQEMSAFNLELQKIVGFKREMIKVFQEKFQEAFFQKFYMKESVSDEDIIIENYDHYYVVDIRKESSIFKKCFGYACVFDRKGTLVFSSSIGKRIVHINGNHFYFEENNNGVDYTVSHALLLDDYRVLVRDVFQHQSFMSMINNHLAILMSNSKFRIQVYDQNKEQVLFEDMKLIQDNHNAYSHQGRTVLLGKEVREENNETVIHFVMDGNGFIVGDVIRPETGKVYYFDDDDRTKKGLASIVEKVRLDLKEENKLRKSKKFSYELKLGK